MKLLLELVREDGDSMDSERWELALLESLNELNNKGQGEEMKAKELMSLNQESTMNEKQGFSYSFQNPIMGASNDKSLTALALSPSSFITGLLKKHCLIAPKDRSSVSLMRFGAWDYG